MIKTLKEIRRASRLAFTGAAVALVAGCNVSGMTSAPATSFMGVDEARMVLSQELGAGEWVKAPYVTPLAAPGAATLVSRVTGLVGLSDCREKVSIGFMDITDVRISTGSDPSSKTGVFVEAEGEDGMCSYGMLLSEGKTPATNEQRQRIADAFVALGTRASAISLQVPNTVY